MKPPSESNPIESDAHLKLILENTQVASTPLVPEVRLRLLRGDSPLWRAFGSEPDAADLPRPYWAFAWSGGQALARYVLDHPELVRGRSVLDFGAGGGIASIAAAKAGAAGVTACEVDPLAIPTMLLNASLNEVAVTPVCEDLIYSENCGWDIVLAGDIWYDSRMARHGLTWLRLLAGGGVTVLSADPGRVYTPTHGVAELASYAARSVPDLEHPALQQVRVYRILPAAR